MVGSVNKVILIGNLGRDPDIRSMQSGNKMASFSIATSKRWKDKNTQEQKEKTSWHNIVVFGDGLVSIIEQFVMIVMPCMLVFMFYIMLDMTGMIWWLRLIISIGMVSGLIGLITLIINYFHEM